MRCISRISATVTSNLSATGSEKRTKLRSLPHTTRDPAIKPVGDSGHNEDDCRTDSGNRLEAGSSTPPSAGSPRSAVRSASWVSCAARPRSCYRSPSLTHSTRAVRSVIHRMQVVINCARDRVTDAFDLGQLLHAGVFDRFGAAEMPQQLATALGANTGNILQE